MKRNWERERNYWLDHFGQYHPGNRRNSDALQIRPTEYVGIPVPPGLSTPLNPSCLAWRWKLRGGGYGTLQGRGAHVIAFEQTRERAVRKERQVNHLCNRPFCVQPAHLYEGTAKQNAEDRQADAAGGRYSEWRAMAHRFDRTLTRRHWTAPEPEAVSAGWGEPLECPHGEMPEMFEKKGKGDSPRLCANCGAERRVTEGRTSVEKRPCGMPRPCRCPEEETPAGIDAGAGQSGTGRRIS